MFMVLGMKLYQFYGDFKRVETEDGSEVEIVTQISILDLICQFHLLPNDSSTMTVVSMKLKWTENYSVWSCAMLLALEGKNKTDFIDGSCRRSNTDEVLGKQWDKCNVVVLGWILNSISEDLYMGQIFSKKASIVLQELKETYDRVDGLLHLICIIKFIHLLKMVHILLITIIN